ncbi:hypothetical protein AB0I94_06420 [Streptomyces sp. NPDC050147]|uniref:hypothetical protein n=1 Tax=Streptomyces sp. NPDC050147 TaxID=3155513 RepID=UPI00343B8EE8
MPADEVHQVDSAGEARARSGPRHAAPRKPLLTRLHVPAGKAIAIAAMPTAVLMGMGLTPQLAQAKPLPKNPFQDGPCVTAPDDASEATKEADKAAEEKAEKEKAEQAEKEAADKADKTGKGDDGKATAEPTPAPAAGDKAGSDAGSGKAEPTPSPSQGKDDKDAEPAPEPSESKNPLDPLGVGPALEDLFTPDEKESKSPTPTPSASEESKSPRSGTDAAKDTVDDVTKPVEDTVGGVTDGVKDGAGKAGDTVDKAKEDAKEDAEKAAEKAADEAEAEESADPMAPDENGKKPFPCVVEKKVDGKAEQTPAPIPNQPWHLEASSLTLKGADYQGVVNLTMPGGKTKQALKYVVQNTDIGDLHQIVEGPAGKKYHVQAEKGSTSTIRGGETTMYTESISGKLFGLIPITFDPEHPPPLNIPLIYFTDVKVQQAGQFGGNLHVPGLSQTITD